MTTLDLDLLATLRQKPAPFTPGEPLFWDDPHISTHMLEAHLDPHTDAASRRPETIDHSVVWITKKLGLAAGDTVLDLGCGPGLYATRFASRDLRVTGVDCSRRSIEYATDQARRLALPITYRREDYLHLQTEAVFDAVLLIYGDYCVLSPAQRSTLLGVVWRSLRPGGHFVVDVTTRESRNRNPMANHWSVQNNGFWRSTPHLTLEEDFDYRECSVYLEQVVVVEATGRMTVYRMWFQDFTGGTITTELEQGRFTVESLWNDLWGTPYAEPTGWIGVVACKP
jgi:SAM-dependent methyltransferase